jgi:hypothetical protein
VEPPYLPLLCTKFTHSQHELTMLIVLGAIILPTLDLYYCSRPMTCATT